jgi:hypothetical protein
MRSTHRIAIPLLALAAVGLLAPTSIIAAEGHFDKTLSVNGAVTLNVSTGSGYIHITPGADNQVHIQGHVKSSNNWMGGNSGQTAEQRVNDVVNNPPIDQTGNIIRVGKDHGLNHVSIDYDITAPKSVTLTAGSGSGDVRVSDVGQNAKLNTGSGNIEATGLVGTISLETGSGDITASQNSSGDVKAGTGSGNIHLNNIQGGLKAETGSGNIEVAGKPTSPWKLGTGSGDVTLSVSGAAFDLDASTGSGGIQTDVPITVQGNLDKHHITGKVNGGGPAVRIETGSGSVHIH